MYPLSTTMTISALALGCQLADATPLQDDAPSVVVRFADLDLTHSDGVAVLYRRLKDAAERVCAARNGRDIRSQTRYKVCWQGALSTSVGKVNQPALTAYYGAQFKGRDAPFQIAQK